MTSQPPSIYDHNPFESESKQPESQQSDFMFLDDPIQAGDRNESDPIQTRGSMGSEVNMDTDVGVNTEITNDGSPSRETLRIPDAFEGINAPQQPAAGEALPHYVHGIVQGVHAYLITNLMGGESETLLQSQMIWTLGRNRQVSILLRDSGLSRRHAAIQYITRQGFYLIDLGSMNGSFVNGMRVKQRHLLEDGDRVTMGSMSFIFYTSCRHRTLEPVHSDVLAQLNDPANVPMPIV